MCMNYRQIVLFLLLFQTLFPGFVSLAQESFPSGDLRKAYEGFDATIGIQNTRIFTGLEYIEEHRMINEKNKFFLKDEFRAGTVVYEGQPYFNIPLKYNVFDDLLLVQLPSDRGETVFRLLPNRLNSFVLNSREFVNVWEKDSEFSGIYELLYDSQNLRLLKKYEMSLNKVSGRQLVHYEFEPRRPQYFFSYEGEYYDLSQKNLSNLFPNQRSVVKEQYRKFRKQKREQKENALIAMFQTLAPLSNDNAQ